MQKNPLLLVILILFSTAVCHAQKKSDVSEIYVESWATSNWIREKVLSFDLVSSKAKQTKIIRNFGSGVYKLILNWHPAVKERYQREYWAVELRQVLSEGKKKEKLGDNLLMVEGPGPGKHNFPREDLIADLYPKEKSTDFDKLVQPNGGFFPISTKRVIKVQDFYVIIKVTSFELNKSDPSKLDSMHVTVVFSNSCKNPK